MPMRCLSVGYVSYVGLILRLIALATTQTVDAEAMLISRIHVPKY